jgi:dUTP pyrophosphatase
LKQLVKIFPLHANAVLPIFGTRDSAGADLCTTEAFTLSPGESKVVDTGLIIQPPPGYRVDIRSRSGLAAKSQVTVHNSPGTIDRDYCGPTDTIKIILYRATTSQGLCFFNVGDRIAQMVITETTSWDWSIQTVADFANCSNRDGLGSTGLSSVTDDA